MSRLTLERYQVWAYLIAIGLGLAMGTAWPGIGPAMETLLWPTLAALLFATFLQVPLLHVRDALRDRRFAGAVLLGNFVVLPLLAWALVEVFDFDPVVRLGVLLVLLVPCTDWFITFSQLGKGDVPRAIAITPLNLVLQLRQPTRSETRLLCGAVPEPHEVSEAGVRYRVHLLRGLAREPVEVQRSL